MWNQDFHALGCPRSAEKGGLAQKMLQPQVLALQLYAEGGALSWVYN